MLCLSADQKPSLGPKLWQYNKYRRKTVDTIKISQHSIPNQTARPSLEHSTVENIKMFKHLCCARTVHFRQSGTEHIPAPWDAGVRRDSLSWGFQQEIKALFSITTDAHSKKLIKFTFFIKGVFSSALSALNTNSILTTLLQVWMFTFSIILNSH